MVDVLLQSEAVNIYLFDKHGWTAAHTAASRQNLAVLRSLLRADVMATRDKSLALVVRQDNTGKTPLHWACSVGSTECALELAKSRQADIQAMDFNGNTALHCACLSGNKDLVKHLRFLLCTPSRRKTWADLYKKKNREGYMAEDILRERCNTAAVEEVFNHPLTPSMLTSSSSTCSDHDAPSPFDPNHVDPQEEKKARTNARRRESYAQKRRVDRSKETELQLLKAEYLHLKAKIARLEDLKSQMQQRLARPSSYMASPPDSIASTPELMDSTP